MRNSLVLTLWVASLSPQTEGPVGARVVSSVSSTPLTSNQNNFYLTNLGPSGWRYFGSSNYTETQAGSTGMSALTSQNAGGVYTLNSKAVYPYWTDGAASAPFYSAVQGNSLLDLRTNSGGLASQTFTAPIATTQRVLSVLTVASNNATTHLTASLTGSSATSAESIAGSEVYNLYQVIYSGDPTDHLTVTLSQSVSGTDVSGQPAIAVVAAWVREISYTPNPIPQLITGLTDPTSGITRPTGSHVHAVELMDDFQNFLNKAIPGDEYDFPDGYLATGNFVLPHRTDSQYTWLVHLPTRNAFDYTMRVNPGDFAPGVTHQPPKIQTLNADPILRNDFLNPSDSLRSTRGWIWDGFEITTTFASTYQLVLLAPADPNGGDTRAANGNVPDSDTPSDIMFLHCWAHGRAGENLARGYWMDVNNGVVQGNYISDVHNPSYEGNAILIHNTTGLVVLNNYLEANGENMMMGASGPDTGQIPSNISIKYNLFRKPLSGQTGQNYKNLLECKNCSNVEAAYNVFENSYISDFPTQEGTAFLITPRTTCGQHPANTAQYINFHDNIIFHVLEGLSLQVMDDSPSHCGLSRAVFASVAPLMNPGHDVTLRNNLFFDVSKKWQLHGESNIGVKLVGVAFNAGSGTNAIAAGSLGKNIVFDHNTLIMNEPLPLVGGSDAGYYLSGSVFTQEENTVFESNYIGRNLFGDGNPGSWSLPNSGNNGKNDRNATFTHNCIESADTNPMFSDYRSAPTTIVNATCPSSRGAAAATLLLREGAIRSGNRSSIYALAQ